MIYILLNKVEAIGCITNRGSGAGRDNYTPEIRPEYTIVSKT